jgi:hypothetical protein
MVVIEVNQTRVVEAGPDYVVDTKVLAVQNIDSNIFVFNTGTQEFDHVAAPWDMENYPNSRNEAILKSIDYYRQTQARVSYGDNQATAAQAATYTLARIDTLARQYDATIVEFEGSEDHIFSEGV